MNDYKGMLLFLLGIIEGAKGYKKLPKFLNDEIDMFADRWGCSTFEELRAKVRDELKEITN